MNINFQYRAEQELSERLSPAGRLHSQLAMRAAKGMAVTRQKKSAWASGLPSFAADVVVRTEPRWKGY